MEFVINRKWTGHFVIYIPSLVVAWHCSSKICLVEIKIYMMWYCGLFDDQGYLFSKNQPSFLNRLNFIPSLHTEQSELNLMVDELLKMLLLFVKPLFYLVGTILISPAAWTIYCIQTNAALSIIKSHLHHDKVTHVLS